ncbi:Sir2 family NAD-dependent protein deacetylase [Luteibaculum oceani]|uniref:protein acetyllysine N-acetyltransferase n=1 Tax=Luteibaculum oceani TaxID=1294296 RepID=A0A5C6VJN9_9FLAO|nr:Sir2 family NAD-dependent protein deacetylase [Luteibaculum oceani]TXC85059.1 NAD-dependent deacylase [Luteibaculum oceani]
MSKKKLAVLTGAGISAESGLKTFRDGDGLWENHSVYDVATPEAWQRNPNLVLRFYEARWKQMKTVQPNAAHQGLKTLETDFQVEIITQNIDDLHERASSNHILHLHGEINKVCSDKNPFKPLKLPNPEKYITLDDRAADGGKLRPYVVWFGEPVPAMEQAAEIVISADALVIIGTSLQVYPAAGLVNYLHPSKPIFILDPNPMAELSVANPIYSIAKKAGEAFEELKTLIDRNL